MDFGIHIGTRGCLATRENVMAMATSAEAHGYAIIGVAGHLIVPVHTDVRYPYTATARGPARRQASASTPSQPWPSWPASPSGSGC